MKYLLLFCFLVVLACCKHGKNQQSLQEKQKELGAGMLDEKSMYTVKEVGWTVQLPKDWTLVTQRQSGETTKKGQGAVEQWIGTKIYTSELVYLVSGQRNKFRASESTMELFDASKDGSYENQTAMVRELIRQAY